MPDGGIAKRGAPFYKEQAMMKSEIQNPKSERNPKPEFRIAEGCSSRGAGFPRRTPTGPLGLRAPDFGLRISGFLLLALLLMALAQPAFSAAMNAIPLPSDGKGEAVKVAQAWVALLDAGKFDDGWKQAAVQLKKAVSQKKWKTTMSPLRNPLGAVSARQEKSAQLTREIPGAPDAQYAVVEFSTTFATKSAATEVVTLIWENDGRWRVSSYAIR